MSIKSSNSKKFKMIRKSRRAAVISAAWHSIEVLESRLLLSATTWTNAAGGDFDTGANWSNGVPGAGVNAIISIAVSAPITKSGSSDTFASLTSSDPITMSGGSLILNGGTASSITGALNISGGTIEVTGNGTTLSANGNGTISNATLDAESGAIMTFAQATGLSAVNLTANGGGQLLFPMATSYSGNNRANTTLSASGSASKIDLSHLQTFTGGGYTAGVGNYGTSVLPTSSGEIDLAGAISTANARFAVPNTFTLDSTGGVLGVAGVTNLDYTSLTVGGGQTLSFTALTELTATDLTATGGSKLLFPTVTYTGDNFRNTTLSASGSASKIDLSHLQTFTGGGYTAGVGNYGTSVLPTSSGEIDLAGAISTANARFAVPNTFTLDNTGGVLGVAGVTNLDYTSLTVGGGQTLSFTALTELTATDLTATGGSKLLFPTVTYTGDNFRNTTLSASGSASKIDLSHLQTFTGGGYTAGVGNYGTSVLPTSSGEIDLAGAISTANARFAVPNTFTLDNTGGVLGVAGVTNLDYTSLTVGGGQTLSFTALTELTATDLTATGGSKLLFPTVTYTGDNFRNTTLSASGSASKIDLSHLQTFTGGGYTAGVGNYGTSVLPTSSGEIDLAGAISTANARFAVPNTFTLDSTGGVLGVAGVTNLDYTSLTVGGGQTLSFTALTELTATDLTATGGSKLLFPTVTYTGDNFRNTTLSASGSASKIDLSHLQTFTGGGYTAGVGNYGTSVLPTSSGEIDLAGAISTANARFAVPNTFTLDNTGGVLGVAGVTNLDYTSLTVGGGQTLSFTALTELTATDLAATGGSKLLFPTVTYTGDNFRNTTLSASGSASKIDLSHLQTFTGGGYTAGVGNYGTSVLPTSSGEIDLAGAISTANARFAVPNTFTLDSTGGVLGVAGVTNLDYTSLTVGGGQTLSFTALTELTATDLAATGGSKLLFPTVTYTGDNFRNTTLSASGSASKIDLSHLQTFTGGGYTAGVGNYGTSVLPTSSGEIDLAGAISTASGGNLNAFSVSGNTSVLNLDGVTSVTNTVVAAAAATTLDFPATSNIHWLGGDTIKTADSTASVQNDGIISASGVTLTISAANFSNDGVLSASNGGTLNITGSAQIIGSGILSSTSTGTIDVGGNLLGSTTGAALFAPQGGVVFDGSGNSTSPQELEAMGNDLGAVSAGFSSNFVYSTLTLSNNTDVKLVDLSKNSTGTGNEAVYANTVIVPTGSTLNLNGLNLYARATLISGTVTGGNITQVAGGGAINLGQTTPSKISLSGGQDSWTFFARAGASITVAVDTGSSALIAPTLQYAQVEVLNASNVVVGTPGSNSAAGQPATLNNVTIPTDGTYTVQVRASTAHPTNTGDYSITVWDTTPNVQTLNLNQQATSTIGTPYAVDQWNFSAAAGTQVRFNLLGASAPGLVYSLSGPSGFTGFTNISGGSGLITLPSNGQYTLTTNGTSGATGSYTFDMVQTTQTTLPLGTLTNGTFTGSGEAQLFAVNVTSAQPLSLVLTDPTAADHTELYANFGLPPTRQTFAYDANGTGASHSLLVPNAAIGTWYILVYSESVPTPDSFTLQASSSPVVVQSVTPTQYGANAGAQMTVTGAGFDTTSTVSLISSGGTSYPASTTVFNTFTQLTANFNLSSVPQGTYAVSVKRSDGGTGQLLGAFTVTNPGQANLQTKLITPANMGYHESSTVYVQYSNTGTVAMPAPVILLESSLAVDQPLFTLNPALQVSGFWTSALPQGYSNTVEILASGKTPGVLEPGESETVPVYYAGMQQPWPNPLQNSFGFDLRVFTSTDTDSVNWSSLQSSLKPASVSTAAWNTIYGNLISQLGNTWGGYVETLDNEAAYLGQLGEDVTDINSLWGFAVQQADNALNPVGPYLASVTDDSVATPGDLSLDFSRVFATTIYGRDIQGPLGMGWSTPWQSTAILGSDLTVTITEPSGAQRVFQPDSRTSGAYFASPGDTGTLTGDGSGGYLLTEANGIATDYSSNGSLNYMQDTHGNRITAGYTSGLLASLTASSGQSITISYNSAKLISSITDSAGRTTTYNYDPTNTYLTSVNSYNGQTTTYAYNTTAGSPAQNALTSITFPGNTHQYFSYDSEGRLASTSQDGGARTYTFAYSLGQVSVTDILNDTTSFYYNESGLVTKSIDPLGNVTLGTYDADFNLSSITNAAGQSESYAYNSVGEVTSWTDFLGNTTNFSYTGPFNELSSMTDANGNKTSYAYNPSGDLLDITYANGTSESFGYNPEGDATSFIDANGQPISYTYNSAGQVTGATFSDGSKYAYTYDTFGNLLTATDATGVTRFTYAPTTGFLTNVAYPNGTALTFTYNAAGQRATMVDQSGFTTIYLYNSDGWLSGLTDGSGNPIVTYTYCNCGHLMQKTNGNGTYTTYAYDADGNLLDLVNYAPNKAINSSFVYTYNSLGLETSETTLQGAWTYSYDADGQLTHAVFASNNTAVIPSQNLAYSYDALGNRIVTVINGVTTTYVTNNVNEYTSVGTATYKYDANGNLLYDGTNTYTYNSLNQLTSVTGTGGTTTYTYNSLGQLVSTTTGGQTTQYLIDPTGLGDVVGTYNGAGNVTSGNLIADYTHGLGLTSQVTSGGTDFYDFDAQGSTVGISNSSGVYQNQYSYLPFGGLLSSAGNLPNPYQFIGQFGVIELSPSLSKMGARAYSTGLGRFVTPDPDGLGGGDENLYRYASNDPVEKIDPGGRNASQRILCILAVKALAQAAEIAIGLEEYVTEGLTPPPLVLAEWAAIIKWELKAEEACNQIPTSGPPFNWPWNPSPVPTPVGSPTTAPPVSPTVPSRVDPNAKIGPSGFGSSNFVSDSGENLPYTVDFENSSTATAPAQEVTVTDQLSSSFNWSTFQLSAIGWGDFNLTIPAGRQYYQTTVPMTYGGQTFDVVVTAGIHTATGLVYATFFSVDPATALPPDVLVGFLPPEDKTGRGKGYFSYTVQPNSDLSTGTPINNVAAISFDGQPIITTDQVNDEDPSQGINPAAEATVTIDAGAPTSAVTALPTNESSSTFTVSWTGQDDANGSGVASYSVYASDDGGAYIPFVSNSTATSATFTGAPGQTYSFYSIATDNVGNVQATPTGPQPTTTTPAAAAPLVTTNPLGQILTVGQDASFTAAASGNPAPTVQWMVKSAGGSVFSAINGATSPTLDLGGATLAESGNSYEAVFSNGVGTPATTTAATLTVNAAQAAPAITANPANQSLTVGQDASFTAAASGSPAPTVQWMVKLAGGSTFSAMTGATAPTLDLGGATLAESGNSYEAVFSNGIGTPATTTAATLTVSPAASPTLIDSGGPAAGNYVADTDFSGGSTFSTTSTVNTSADPTGAPASVYQSERWGNFTYTVPNLVAGNTYSVRLHFSENYWNSAGQRLFNVSINGSQVLSSFDIFKTAGGEFKAIVESFSATADTNGKITIVFTGVKDNAKVNAVDVVPTTVTPAAPAVTTNPISQIVTAGQTVGFTAAASGNPTPTVQWQVSSGGGAFANITANASATTTTLTLAGVGTALSGNQYQAVFTNGVGSPATTTAATLTVNAAPSGTFIDSGGAAVGSYVADTDFSGGSTFATTSTINTSADPTGAPASVYQSERWGNFTYTVPNLVAGNTYSVRLHFSENYWNSAGQRLFNVSINGQQVLSSFDIFAAAGGEFKAVVESFTATANSSGQIAITFTNVKDNAKVSAIDVIPTIVTPTAPAVTANPASQSLTVGQDTSFTAAASGSPAPTVQWMVKAAGGSTYSAITGATSPTLDLGGATLAESGNSYEAVFTNGVGTPATTTAATLTVNAAPSGTFIDSGGAAAGSYVADTDFSGGSTFSTTSSINTSADTTGAPASVYQTERWGNFTYTVPNLIAGNTYTVRLHFSENYWSSAGQRLFNVSINGQQVLSSFDIFAAAGGEFKAVVESFTATANASGQIAIAFTNVKDNAKVSAIDVIPTTVTPTAPAITTNPQNQIVTAGQPVSFTAAASGTPTPTVQWQVSSGGGAFTNITGNASATTTTLTLTGVGTAMSGNQYQAVFTNGVGSPATSNPATLTVNAAPTGTFIDSGGAAVGSYVADTDFSGGSTFSTTSSINTSADTTGAPASVYQTERWGNFTYTVPNLVAGNSYTVRLHFSENYWNSAGQRLFNVSINGTQVLSSFDIFKSAGGEFKAIVESFTATANASGQIAIVFTSVKDNAKVSAIDVVPTA